MSKLTRFAFLLALPLAAPFAGASLQGIPLEYSEEVESEEFFPEEWNPALAKMTFRVQSAVDRRKDTLSKEIGFSNEKRKNVTTSSSIPHFVNLNVRRGLSRFGLKQSHTTGTRLFLDVLDLYVDEGGQYEGKATIRFTLLSDEGDTLAATTTTGLYRHRGRDYTAENYMQAITGAVHNSLDKFLKYPVLRKPGA